MYRPNLKSVALPVAEIIAIEFLGGLRAPNLRAEEAVGGRGLYGTVRKSVGEFYIGPS